MMAGSFPTVERLAAASEAELRECKLGFRAPYLSGTARKLAAGELDLSRLGELPLEEARAALLTLPGVGIKIADCVLLFAYGFQKAFPVDVWITKALQQLYFPKRGAKLPRLRHFSRSHFGPYSGYAQQYLFHYMRTRRNPDRANLNEKK
jgi:N-glycosylase/DNA lyase